MLSQSQLQTQLMKSQSETQPHTQSQTQTRAELLLAQQASEAQTLRSETQLDQLESHPTQHETQVEAQPETQLNALKFDTQTVTKLDIQPDTQHETQPETRPDNEMQLDGQLETQQENEMQLDSQLETQRENEMQLDTQLETQPEMQMNSPLETQPENGMQLDSQLEMQSENEMQLDTQLETQPENQMQLDTQLETQPENEMQMDTQLDTQSENQMQLDTQLETQSENQMQLDTQLETQSENQMQLDTQLETQSENEMQLDTQLETQPENEMQLDTQLETQPENQMQMDTQLDTQPENQMQLDAQLESQSENQMQLDTQLETQSENQMQLDTQLETQSDNEMQLDAQFKNQPETQLDSQNETQPENEMQLDSQHETQLEIQLDNQRETQPENEAQVVGQVQIQHEIQPEIPQAQPEAQQQPKPQPDTIQPWLSVQPFVRPTVQKPKAALTTGRPQILSLPYPVEHCGAELQRAFPGRIGRYYVTNAFNYAYACNRMSIEMAAESMGFDKRNYLEAVRTLVDQRSGASKSSEARLEELGRDLEKDTRLTLMILKPREMSWSKLGNSLLFERSHPERRHIADKWQLFLVLRRSAGLRHLQLTTASGRKFDYNQFILYTANPGNFQRDLMLYLDSHPGTYILKRTNYSQGIGIRIYQAEKPNTVDKLRRCVGIRAGLHQFVLQKYIERPLLVDKRKFDLRVYMMLLSCKRPVASGGFEHSYFAFCYPGYVKLSCYPYNQVSRDMHVHLTNQFVQKQRRSMYSRVKEATTWFPDELNEYLNRRGRTEADWCQKRLYGRIRTIVGYMAAAFRPHLDSAASPASVFRIYGPDFIIDEDLRVWLLEVNTFPSYAKNTTALSGSIRNMWREAVTVATEATLRYRSRLPVEGLSSMRNFCMAYSSEDPLLLSELVRRNFQ